MAGNWQQANDIDTIPPKLVNPLAEYLTPLLMKAINVSIKLQWYH